MIKGSKMTKESREKISKSLLGNKYAFGYHHTEETKQKISNSLKGGNKTSFKKGQILSDDIRKKLSLARKGKSFTKEHRKNMSGAHHWNWRGGVTSINETIRKSLEYKLWRQTVFIRDNFKCIWCGNSKKIEADHIKPFAYYPELRFALDNGRTLCSECHKTTDTYAGKSKK